MPVQFLSEADHDRLNRFPEEIPKDEHFTYFLLSEADHTEIGKQRSDSTRLGFAVQICALRYMGFVPNNLLSIPPQTLKYIAQQLQVLPDALTQYSDRIRRSHLKSSQEHVGFRRATELDILSLETWLLERALEHDKPTLLFKLACEHLKQQQIVRIGTTRLAQVVSTARNQAHEVTYKILQPLLSKALCDFLDDLLKVDEASQRTTLYWLQTTPTDHNLGQMLETLDKITFLQQQGVVNWDLSGLNPNRVKLLAQKGSRATNQYLQRVNPVRRYPVLVCFLKQSLYNFTDVLIEMFDQRLWELYAEAKREFKEDRIKATKSINQKLQTFQEIGQILLDPEIDDKTVRASAFEQISPDQLQCVLGETKQLIRPEHDAYVDYFGHQYARIRRFSGKFLTTLEFHAHSDDGGLLQAINCIRDLHAGIRGQLPRDTQIAFVPTSWRAYVIEDEGFNPRYFELATLWILRQKLRSGEIYAAHSRRFDDLESYFIPKDEWPQHQPEVLRLTGVPLQAEVRLAEREADLITLMERVEALLNEDGDLREENGNLVLTPLEAQERTEQLDQLETAITARIPEVDITDVLIEVDTLTGFSDHFEHLNSADQGRSKDLLLHLYACLLAQACNLGLWQIAKSTNLSYQRLSWCNTWYIRDETLREATKVLVNYHYHLPLSHLWGDGILSSSDGQRFPVKGKVRQARALPRYFGYGKGITFYTWVSDQFSQYGAKPIPSTHRDATYVLDERLNNETELPLLEHTTDTAGYTELVSALYDLLGMRFCPRIRDIGGQRLYRTANIKMKQFPKLKAHVTEVINKQRVIASWDEILHLVGSLQQGWVTASLIIQKLQAYPRQHPLMLALQEYGKLISTLQTLRWYEDEYTRSSVSRQLNKGEAVQSLREHLFYANQGKVKGKPDEQLLHQVECLNLVTNIVIIWNTIYMSKAVKQLRSEGYPVDDEDLKRVWPTRLEHLNVHGRYQFNLNEIRKNRRLRELRKPKDLEDEDTRS
jgi:TnpA family transposase